MDKERVLRDYSNTISNEEPEINCKNVTKCESSTMKLEDSQFRQLRDIALETHMILMTYFEPTVAFIVIFWNIITIIYFAPSSVSKHLGKSTRMYYIVIAVGDIVSLAAFRIVVSLFGYGFLYITKGKIDLQFDRLNDYTCKVFYYIFNFTEQMSSYALVLFSLERLFIVHFPLKARAALSYKKTCIINFIVLMLLALFDVHLLISLRVEKSLATSYCLVPLNSQPLFETLYWITMGVVNFAFPIFLILILDILIIRKIISASNARKSLTMSEGENKESAKEYIATLSLVFLAGFQALIYLPVAIVYSYMTLQHAKILPQIQDRMLYDVEQEVAWVTMHITSWAKATNFIVYYTKIPFFKKKINNLVRSICCCSNISSLSSQSTAMSTAGTKA